MKVPKFVSILIFICFCVAAYSQDVIVTKDSRHIQAVIIEVSPTQVRYKVYGKPESHVFSIPVKEVKSIIYESDLDIGNNAESETPQPENDDKYIQEPTINAFIENSFSFYPSHSLKSIDPVRAIIGVQFNDHFFVGAGASVTIFADNIYDSGYEMIDTVNKLYYDELPRFNFTTFLSGRFTYRLKEQVIPFAEIEAGYSMCKREWTREFFGSPFFSVGIGIVIWHFEISAGYEYYILPLDRMYKHEYWTFFNNLSHPNGSLNMGNIFIKIGANIGRVTN